MISHPLNWKKILSILKKIEKSLLIKCGGQKDQIPNRIFGGKTPVFFFFFSFFFLVGQRDDGWFDLIKEHIVTI
jgi:hypothetical protein